jgi:hypothetical protein
MGCAETFQFWLKLHVYAVGLFKGDTIFSVRYELKQNK